MPVSPLADAHAYHCNFKCIFEDLLPCYCYATKANNRTIRSRVSQPASADKEVEKVNCKLITACYQNSEPDSCAVSVSVISANKLSLQEVTQLTRIKLLILRFLEIFASLSHFPEGGKCPLCPLLRTPMVRADNVREAATKMPT